MQVLENVLILDVIQNFLPRPTVLDAVSKKIKEARKHVALFKLDYKMSRLYLRDPELRERMKTRIPRPHQNLMLTLYTENLEVLNDHEKVISEETNSLQLRAGVHMVSWDVIPGLDDIKSLSKVRRTLTSLALYNCMNLDVSVLSELDRLEHLCISPHLLDREVQAKFAIDEGRNLQRVWLEKQVANLVPSDVVFNLQSKAVFFRYSKIRNPDVLGTLKNLTSLDIYRGELVDISFTQGMKNLKHFGIGYNHVKDLGPLRHLTGLHSLDLLEPDITDYSPVNDLQRLRSLTFMMFEPTSFDFLSRLTELRFMRFRVGTATEIPAAVSNLPNLKYLCLKSSLYLMSLSSLRGTPASKTLKFIDCSFTNISDISVIAEMPQLEALSLSGACDNLSIQHIAQLPELSDLDISESGVDNLSGLIQCVPKLKRLTALRMVNKVRNLKSFKTSRPEVEVRYEKYTG